MEISNNNLPFLDILINKEGKIIQKFGLTFIPNQLIQKSWFHLI